MKRISGFTLVELMIVLAIAAILLTLAAPSFRDLVLNNRLSVQTNRFVSAVNISRSEAIKRGVEITLASKNGNDWSDGWEVQLSSDSSVLYDGEALDASSTFTGSVSSIDFSPNGRKTSTGSLNFGMCDDRSGETGRTITIEFSGRPSVTDKTDCS